MQFGTYVKWLNMKINTSVFNYKILIKIADGKIKRIIFHTQSHIFRCSINLIKKFSMG